MGAGGCAGGCIWDSSSRSPPGLWAAAQTGGAIPPAPQATSGSLLGEAARVLAAEQELEGGDDGKELSSIDLGPL